MKFSLKEAIETVDLLDKTKNTLTARWDVDDVDEAPTIDDVLGKMFVITRASLNIDASGPRLYLGGLRCSLVNSRVLPQDNFLVSVVDLEDHFAAMCALGIELAPFRSPRHGRIDTAFFEKLD